MLLKIRELRRKLLMNNNLRKYSLYALGEIILIVAGILIALEIDNWNQHKIQLNEEQMLIQTLREEFQANLEELKVDIVKVSNVKDGLYELLVVLEKRPENFTSEDMDRLLARSFTSPSWDPSSYVLSDLKNSGRISTISNQELKQLLFDWERLYSESIKVREAYSDFARSYYDIITKYGSTRNVDSYFPERKITKSRLVTSNLPLLEQAEFENAASNFLALTDSLILRYQKAEELIMKIISAADKPL